MTKKKDHQLRTASLAYWNYPEFSTKEFQEESMDYIVMRSEEVLHKMSVRYGVPTLDMIGWLAENVGKEIQPHGNRNRT